MANPAEITKNKRIEDMGHLLFESGYRHLLGGLPLSKLNIREQFGNSQFAPSSTEGFLSLDKPGEIFKNISGIILRDLSIGERRVLGNDGIVRVWQVGKCPLFDGQEKLGNMVFSYNEELKMLKAEIPVSTDDFEKKDESEILGCLRDNFGKPIYDNRIGSNGFWIDILAWGSDSDMPEAGHFGQAFSWVYPESFGL